jgi:hypothetical protein
MLHRFSLNDPRADHSGPVAGFPALFVNSPRSYGAAQIRDRKSGNGNSVLVAIGLILRAFWC